MIQFNENDFINNKLYLETLSVQFPTVRSVAAEIINLQAILGLPKGTEHFISDIHGEYETFRHILNNASGAIREKIDILFGNTLSLKERSELATIIYYPKQKLNSILSKIDYDDEFYRLTIIRLIAILRLVSSKYTRSRVRKSLPADFAYIIEELLYENNNAQNKDLYREKILDSIIDIGQSEAFIIALSDTIKRLIVAHLHVVGDVFDRGPRPDIVLDDLMNYHFVDIQWGNHDILWMGAASGSRTCIANALNNAFSYGNLETIEMGYGISLRPLAMFADEVYGNTDVSCFMPKTDYMINEYSSNSPETVARMHKAIAIILFKLEGQIIKRHPEFNMEERLLLDKVDFNKGTVIVENKEYRLKDYDFPTVDRNDVYALSFKEQEVMEQLKNAFLHSEKLQRHINFLFSKGSIYKCYNDNLLFHSCVPMNDDGSFMTFCIEGRELYGKSLFEALEKIARRGHYAAAGSKEQLFGKDYMWFMWCGKNSPLFGRTKITTFEHLLIDDTTTHKEPMNSYYSLYDDECGCIKILREFGLDNKHSHIINGHIPVKLSENESPIKANGKIIVIDGGMCKAYFDKTGGNSGYTLVYNSYGMRIISHAPFCGITDAIENNKDILSTTSVFDVMEKRIRVAETDIGKETKKRIEGLIMLLQAYQKGFLNEKS